MTGCILTDDPTTTKFVLTHGLMAPNTFRAFDQTELGFSLSLAGDDIYLMPLATPRRSNVIFRVLNLQNTDSVRYFRIEQEQSTQGVWYARVLPIGFQMGSRCA